MAFNSATLPLLATILGYVTIVNIDSSYKPLIIIVSFFFTIIVFVQK